MYQQSYASKSDSLGETSKFLSTYNLPTLNKETSEQTCGKLGDGSIIKEIPGPDGLAVESYKTFEININLSQTVPKR